MDRANVVTLLQRRKIVSVHDFLIEFIVIHSTSYMDVSLQDIQNSLPSP